MLSIPLSSDEKKLLNLFRKKITADKVWKRIYNENNHEFDTIGEIIYI